MTPLVIVNRLTRFECVDPQCEGQATIITCKCGEEMERHIPGADVECDKCHREYNSSGQELAPREQWGEETGETAADYDAGFNNPERAFE
jgi:hypothetical protein